ncbi:MAG: hypothetical protein K0S45_2629 [Nitrospira sp.]|jgi:hypothetical protein|nr:hypothetical protein [Nitrospira sp.]
MAIYTFAAIMGAFFVTAGLLGFAPGFVSAPSTGDPSLAIEQSYGYLFGLFPINLLHNLVHFLIGVAGLLAWRNLWSPRTYARFLGGFYGLLAVMGLIPGLHTMMGLVPIFGHDIWLHAFSAALGIYFGWLYAPVGAPAQSRRAMA